MVNSLGTEAIEKGKEISYQSGWNQIYNNSLSTATFEEKMSLLTLSASSIGYIPEIKKNAKKDYYFFHLQLSLQGVYEQVPRTHLFFT